MAFKVSGATAKNEITTLTFPALAGATAGDHAIFYDASGDAWGVSLDVAGTDPEPSGALWVALDAGKAAHVDISAATTAASVAALVETALNALTGFTAAFTTNDTAADGTMILTNDVDGVAVDADVFDEDESGAGSITVAVDQQGAASVAVLGEGKFDAVLSGSDTEGDYTITFNEKFARAPQVGVTCITDNTIARIVQATTSLVQIQTENLSGVATDADFHMIAIGSDADDLV